ncbi:hypothetical protein CTN01_05810 [Photobacterium angustum]|uniref:hypothetical protein n=1 Tax=Photobacterium angustum TaxID=661 RepID=UPI000D1A5427|nr:hypothetical protein [Photobacterium angustum]PSV95101.1 hypothetical protein CTN01_05810 [Photobacterium angustum]
MNIEWKKNNALVVSQMLENGASGTVDIKIYMDGQRFSSNDFEEGIKKDLYRTIHIYHSAGGLLEVEVELKAIAMEMSQWCPEIENQLLEWLNTFHRAVRATCLSVSCEQDYPNVASLCWHIEHINQQFALLFERCAPARLLQKRFLVIACQEILKLYERLRESGAESPLQLVLSCLDRLLIERNRISGWRPIEQRKKAYHGSGYHDEIEEFAANWTICQHEYLHSYRNASLNHLLTIALSSMLAMSVVLTFKDHLMKLSDHLTLSILILICLLYGGRDVAKELLKTKINKQLKKLNFYQRYKLIRTKHRRAVGKRKTRIKSYHIEGMRPFEPSKLCLQRTDSIVFKKKANKAAVSMYTETHLSLSCLEKYRKANHFRVLNQEGESKRSVIHDNRDLLIKIEIKQSGRSTITKSFRCTNEVNPRWLEVRSECE